MDPQTGRFLLKACARCGGDLALDDGDWQCLQCGRYYYSRQRPGSLLAEGATRHWREQLRRRPPGDGPAPRQPAIRGLAAALLAPQQPWPTGALMSW